MSELYYIVTIVPVPGLDNKEIIEKGVIVPYEEAFDFYQVALFGYGDNVDERDEECKRRRDAGEPAYSESTGCGITPMSLGEKEYFQRRLEGLITLEEYRKGL